MEGVLSATDKQSMVSSFLEIAVGQTAETARQFLQVLLLTPFGNFFFFMLILVHLRLNITSCCWVVSDVWLLFVQLEIEIVWIRDLFCKSVLGLRLWGWRSRMS